MNDYARVRSKNEKKKNKRKLSLSSFSLEASFLPFWSVVSLSFFVFFLFFSFLVFSHYSPLTFDGRLGQVGGENKRRRRDDQKEQRKKKKKKKEKREKNRSAFDSLGSFQTTRGIKEGDARIEGASTRAETKKKRQRRGREKECPV